MIFEDLVAQPLYGDGQLLFVEDRLQEKYFYKNRSIRETAGKIGKNGQKHKAQGILSGGILRFAIRVLFRSYLPPNL
jgi:hypothetical protein